MSTPTAGTRVGDFSLPATGGKTMKLSDLKGSNVVLYFYPKDSTPGCTLEGQDFRDNIRKFSARNTVILGVSRDTVKSHASRDSLLICFQTKMKNCAGSSASSRKKTCTARKSWA